MRRLIVFMDHVDKILAQWNTERPDLDVGPMGIFGRLSRLATHLTREIEKVLLDHGLNNASFDVLATLRRAGAPHRLAVGDLLATTMVTSGTMTNRIDQLEKLGLVERQHNPDDRRSTIIALTSAGLKLVERAVTAHVANQHRLMAALTPQERRAFDGMLRTYLQAFEGPEETLE